MIYVIYIYVMCYILYIYIQLLQRLFVLPFNTSVFTMTHKLLIAG